jgi:16S rRNA processing protein RimM
MTRDRKLKPAPENQIAGSPTPGEPVFLVAGRLRRPHGIAGEIVLEILSDFPERFKVGRQIFVGEDHSLHTISEIRVVPEGLLVHLEGIATREQAFDLRNQLVYVRLRDLPPLPAGTYYHHQLIGLSVIDEAGQTIGLLTEILETGANDVYVVTSPEGKEILIPAVESVVQEVDLEARCIRVNLPSWS